MVWELWDQRIFHILLLCFPSKNGGQWEVQSTLLHMATRFQHKTIFLFAEWRVFYRACILSVDLEHYPFALLSYMMQYWWILVQIFLQELKTERLHKILVHSNPGWRVHGLCTFAHKHAHIYTHKAVCWRGLCRLEFQQKESLSTSTMEQIWL